MANDFKFDVFLSYSVKDKAVVRPIAERLQKEGLRVWFDEWQIKPGDSIPSKIEEGLEHSRVLVLCMSANTFGSDWVRLEGYTFRFRDPLNKDRRFIPLRLDKTPIKGSLTQFLYINWLSRDYEQEYAKLLEACRPPAKLDETQLQVTREQVERLAISLRHTGHVSSAAFSDDGQRALSGGAHDNTVRVWDLSSGHLEQVLEGHAAGINHVDLSGDGRRALSGALDHTVRVWDVTSSRCERVLEGHTGEVLSVAISGDGRQALSGSSDHTLRLWDIESGQCERVLEGHTGKVLSVAICADGRQALSGSSDHTLRLWDVESGRCERVLGGHTDSVNSVAISADGRRAMSGSSDKTLRLWDIESGRCERVLEGHTGIIWSVRLSGDGCSALSGDSDGTLRIWDLVGGGCEVIEGHMSTMWKEKGGVVSVDWSSDGRDVLSAGGHGVIRVWDVRELVMETVAQEAPAKTLPSASDQIQYTNAKVLLVGDTSAGKTGLSMRLALDKWEPSDSTVGAWATHWKLPIKANIGIEQEIWLWDFGGQADQRLIHQLYMDDTALAVLVFDGQKEDLFETLGQWDRDLMRASRKEFAKLLVAGRVDAGSLRCSPSQLEEFAKERGYPGFLETSAKVGTGCEELKQAILDGIHWENIPWRTSPRIFKRLKEEIIRLKDEGRVLMRFNELRDNLKLRMTGEAEQFSDEELKAVIGLLAGPGVVWELEFGSWVLLQPERINAYAQAVIQTLRADEFERGYIAEEQVLNGDLTYQSSIERLEGDEERFVLLAMHQILVERGLCFREHTDEGNILIFPSYYRREREELVSAPAVMVSYRFNGFLDEIYATLIVRLHHTQIFEQDQLWRYAADFKTLTKKQLGVKLTRRAEGEGELEVYFDPTIEMSEKIIFSKYVHEHLLQYANDVVRLRHYVCPHCGTPVGNPTVAMRKLEEGKTDIPCMNCDDLDKRIPLWDELEELFANAEMKQRVHELQEATAIVLDNESKERVLVGEVISTVALAGQICREFTVSDHGIDMEIEFKNDAGKATGRKLYLQLKSGDSYLRERKSDGSEIFKITKPRHAEYWREQAFPVLLIIRTSEGEIRWMEIRDYLKRESEEGKKAVKQIVFEGERFDVMSVRRWRDKVLGQYFQ